MKYLLPFTLLIAAALGASQSDTFGGSAPPFAGGAVPARYGDPPWLAEGWRDPVEGLSADETSDPHAGLHGDGDPHAGLYGDDDPHATSLGRTALLEAGLEPRVVVPSTAANGHTIAEIHARRTSLAEHSIRVRGTVIKRTDGILGKSYVHLWDGSAGPETSADDLTITTTEEFQIAETIEVEGRLLVDRDLGLGYRYTALLEGAIRVAAN